MFTFLCWDAGFLLTFLCWRVEVHLVCMFFFSKIYYVCSKCTVRSFFIVLFADKSINRKLCVCAYRRANIRVEKAVSWSKRWNGGMQRDLC